MTLKKGLALLLTLALLLAVLPSCSESVAENEGEVKALFLNVGKADAALYLLNGKRYLVDTGTKDSADALLKALHQFEVTTLDGVFITHTDKDHVGGLKSLLESGVEVRMLYAAAIFHEKSPEKHPVSKNADKFDVPMTWLNAGDVIEVDESIRFATLGPLSKDEENENNNSLVFRLETPQGNLLLTGDMEEPEELALLAAGAITQTAVLKVGHHGEDDASSEAFIYTVKPQIAVISTDSSVETDTPDPKVIKRLWNVGAEVFVTQKATCCVQVTFENGQPVGRLMDYVP